MELEEAIKNVKDEINVDKNNLPIAEANGFEDTKTLLINRIESIETILNHLTKQEKMIDLMAEELAFGVFDFKSIEQAKQYFEKKAEEGINGRNKSWRVYKRLC